jgi:hypothetical protein
VLKQRFVNDHTRRKNKVDMHGVVPSPQTILFHVEYKVTVLEKYDKILNDPKNAGSNNRTRNPGSQEFEFLFMIKS